MKPRCLFLVILSALFIGGGGAVFGAEQEQGQGQRQVLSVQPRPDAGSLFVPAGSEERRATQQCMTVCSRWGEECQSLGAQDGGSFKRCRRACQSFAEECL